MKKAYQKLSFILIIILILISSIGITSSAESNSWWSSFAGPKDFYSHTSTKIVTTKDKGYAISGYSSNGYADGFFATLIKTDNAGKILWSKSFRDTGDVTNCAIFSDLTELSDGSLIAVGQYTRYKAGSNTYRSVLAIKFGADGKILWQKIYTKEGEPSESYATNLVKNNDGTVTIEGTQIHHVDGLGNIGSGFALVIDPASGSKKALYPVGNGLFQPCFSITPDGGFAVAKVVSEISKPYMFSLDTYDVNKANSISMFYVSSIGGKACSINSPKLLTLEDGYLMAGDIYDSVIARYEIVRLDKAGKVIWAKNYTNLNAPGAPVSKGNYSIEQTRNGGFVLSNHSSYDTVDDVVFKINSDGNLDWAKSYGSRGPVFSDVIEGDSGEFIAAAGNALTSLGKEGDLIINGLSCKSTDIAKGIIVANQEISSMPAFDIGQLGNDYVPTLAEQNVDILIKGSSYSNDKFYPVRTVVIKTSSFPITATPGTLDFGAVKKGAKSAEKLITLKNKGTKNIKIGNVTLSGTGTKDYSIDLKKTKMTLKSGESTTISVAFSPKSTGERYAVINIISSTSSKDKISISVKGNGK